MYCKTESDEGLNASTLPCRIQHAHAVHHNSRRSSIRQITSTPHARSVWHGGTYLSGKQPSVSVCSHCLGGRQPSVSAPTLGHATLQYIASTCPCLTWHVAAPRSTTNCLAAGGSGGLPACTCPRHGILAQHPALGITQKPLLMPSACPTGRQTLRAAALALAPLQLLPAAC